MVGEKGSGDNYGIGCSKSFSILDIANMFDTKIKMLPERKGNRMTSKVVCEKIKILGWSETKSVLNYIESVKNLTKW